MIEYFPKPVQNIIRGLPSLNTKRFDRPFKQMFRENKVICIHVQDSRVSDELWQLAVKHAIEQHGRPEYL